MIKARVRKRDGRRVYDVRLRDPSGRTYNRTFETKRAAEAFEVEEKAKRNAGAWIDPRRAGTPFEAIAEEWLASDASKRGSSIARDRSILRMHLLPVLGGRQIGSITRAEVQRLVSGWVGRFAPATVGRMYTTLRAVMTYAEESEALVRSPCRSIKTPPATPRRALILGAEDLERLADGMGTLSPMVYLAALGPRWGELAGLRVGDLDFLRRTVTIERQRTRGELGRMVEHEPKTKRGTRTLAVPEWMMTMLASTLADRGISGADADAFVFESAEGDALNYSNWRQRVWLPAVRSAGLDGLTFHDLRHTAATALIDEGVDIKTAQVRLGHSEQVMLRIYAQGTKEADAEAARKVGERFRPRDGRAMEVTKRPASPPGSH